MQIDYNAVSAWAAVIMSIAAIIAIVITIVELILESKRNRFSTGLNAIMWLDDIWKSTRMKQERKIAAQALRDNPSDDIDEILDFFEVVGLLVRRKAIDEVLAWHFYFYWLHGYRTLATAYIDAKRKQESTVWVDLLYLHERFIDIEKRKRKCSGKELAISPEDARQFIEEEINQ
jgi:hypothetical protein